MNYFNRKNIFLWALLVLFVINITALVTILYQVNRFKRDRDAFERFHEPRAFFKKKFKLSDEETEWFTNKHRKFKKSIMPGLQSIREKNNEIYLELISEKPDTVLLYHYAEELGELTERLNKETVDHFLKVFKESDEEKRKVIKEIVHEIFSHGPPPAINGPKPERDFRNRMKMREQK
jgi:hypothetical protein